MERALISFDIGIKNLAVCVMSGNIGDPLWSALRIWEWRLMPLVCEGENCKRMRLDVLSQRIFRELDGLVNGLKEQGCPPIAYVLIENQPSRINGSMKSIQMIIYSYFQYMRYKPVEEENAIREVVLVNARLKLQDHTIPKEYLPNQGEAQGESGERSYKKNKAECVVFARYYVREDEQLRELLEGIKKKDDICDAMLQGIAWLKKNKKTGQVEKVVFCTN